VKVHKLTEQEYRHCDKKLVCLVFHSGIIVQVL